jgi:hypothetical protein
MRHRPRRPRIGLLALGVLLLVAGCDRGPSGPGHWEAVIEGPAPVGSVFLAISGRGIEAVEGAAGTEVFTRSVEGENSVRVVALAPLDPGPLRFRVQVADRGAGPPSASLVELFGRDNRRIGSLDGYRVEFRR